MLKCLCTRHPVLDLLVEFLFLLLDLDSLFVKAIDSLPQLLNCLVLQGVVLVLGIELLNERLKFLLLGLHVNGVALQVVVLLLLKLVVQLLIEGLNDAV